MAHATETIQQEDSQPERTVQDVERDIVETSHRLQELQYELREVLEYAVQYT